MALIYAIAGTDLSIELEPQVLAHFEANKQYGRCSREAGGQLFATLADPKVLRIVAATGPRASDKRSLFGYRPDRKAEQREIHAYYKRDLHFVGDWHTHKQEHPSPSQTDESSMRSMVRESVHDLPGYIMIIVGTDGFPQGLHVSFYGADGSAENGLAEVAAAATMNP